MAAPGISTINNWAAGGATTAFGLNQYYKGKKMEKAAGPRPVYNIPPEVMAGLNEAERQALQGLPEEQKQQYITNLQRGTAYGLSNIGSRKGGLSGVATLNEQQNQGYYNLLGADAAARMQKQQNVFGQLENVANYKGQQFQLNQLNPYYENTAKAQAMMGAGIQNIGNSFQIAAGGAGQGSNPYSQKNSAPQVQSYNAPPVGTQSGYDTKGNAVSVAPNTNPYGANGNTNYNPPQYQLTPYQ